MDKKVITLLKTQCFIDGKWVGTPEIPVTNPATGEEIAKVPRLGTAETKQAIDAAEKAFKPWSQLLAKERAAILRKWFDLQVAHADELALLLTSEQGKPLAEARGEIIYGASFTEFYAEEAKRIYGETIPSFKQGSRIIVIKQPLGVIGAITPWNFPHARITRKVSPLTALALAELARQAGIPPGVFNVITGKSAEIGKELTTSPKVRGITFTGSTEIGKVLMEQSASTIKKVELELGGNAPFLVFDDADIDKAIEGAMASKYRNAGQTCVCANRLLVQEGVYDEFVAKLAKAASAMKVGDGTESGVLQGPLINKAAIEKVEEHIADAVSKGAKIVTGGKRHKLGGTFFEPTVLSGVTSDMKCAREETFGPVAPVFKFKTEAEGIAMANDTEFGLACYFYARDIGRVWRVAEGLEYGMVGINEGIISTEVAPFGGVKESGLGREGSAHGIDGFVELKYMLMGGL